MVFFGAMGYLTIRTAREWRGSNNEYLWPRIIWYPRSFSIRCMLIRGIARHGAEERTIP
jgi:hypothetical protein